eukprot:scaffold71486_cov30-Tisochrysis_lutea.AAC.5
MVTLIPKAAAEFHHRKLDAAFFDFSGRTRRAKGEGRRGRSTCASTSTSTCATHRGLLRVSYPSIRSNDLLFDEEHEVGPLVVVLMFCRGLAGWCKAS